MEDVLVDARTLTTIGNAVNELVTNSVKRAFACKSEGRVFLSATRSDPGIVIAYRDDGPGASREATKRATDGFGMQLVELMVQNMGGTMGVHPDEGFRVEIEIPDLSSAPA